MTLAKLRSGFASTRSSARGVSTFVLVFLAAIFTIVVVFLLSVDVLASVRGYVAGEGLWSKSEKDGVAALTRYLTNGDPAEYALFTQQLEVQLGDRAAREALEQALPDLAAARAGFLRGRNHPSDIDGMSRLFVRFRHEQHLDRAISIWRQGDELIASLQALGAEAEARTSSGGLAESDRAAYLAEVARIDRELTGLEDAFSSTLGDAARWVRDVSLGAVSALTALLAALILTASIRVGRYLHAQEEALRSAARRYRQAFEGNLAGMYRVDLDGRILECNAAFARILGRASPAELQGLTFSELGRVPPAKEVLPVRASERGGVVNHEVCFRRSDGQTVWVLVNEAVVEDAAHRWVTAGSMVDITERRLDEERTRFQALHDPLTRLPNRLLFADRLALALLHAHRGAEKLAVMFLDLDHFKRINDELGHAAGDEVLVEIAGRLRSCLRGDDTVARLGGDEFIFLIPRVSGRDDLIRLGGKILALIREPLLIAGRKVELTGSLGIGLYPDDGADPDELIANVDAAMYDAKRGGRGRFGLYTAPARSANHGEASRLPPG